MRNKKYFYVLFLSLSAILMTSCKSVFRSLNSSDENVFLIEDYNVSFTFPGNWEKDTSEEVFDLQCTDQNSYASIFVYNKIDLAEGQTPEDIYYYQNEDLFSRREYVSIAEEETSYEVDHKQIISTMYSAEKNGTKNYYYVNLVEFEENEDVFAWVLFTAMPSVAEKHIDEWKGIIASANSQKENKTVQRNNIMNVAYKQY